MEHIDNKIQDDEVLRIKRENEEFVKTYWFTKGIPSIALLFLEDYPEHSFELKRILHNDAGREIFEPHLLHIIAGLIEASDSSFQEKQDSEYKLYRRCLLLFAAGCSEQDVYGFLRSIRDNKYTPEQVETLFDTFMDKSLQPKEVLDRFYNELKQGRRNALSASCIVNYIKKIEGIWQDGLRCRRNHNERDERSPALYEYFLSHKEEICTAINEHNLSCLQRSYGDSFMLGTEESRLCKDPPKPSKSAFLTNEFIEKRQTRSNGRDVYCIVRSYRIPVKDTSSLSGYRSAYKFAKTMRFNSNAKKFIHCLFPPHITPDIVAYRCNSELALNKLFKRAKETAEAATSNVRDITKSFHDLYYPIFRNDIFNIFDGILGQDSSKDIHDLFYPYIGLPVKALTPSILKHLLSLPVGQLQEDWSFLESLNTLSDKDLKPVRKIVYNAFRKGLSPKEIESICNKYFEQRITEEYNLSHEQLKQITEHYLPVIQRYKQREMSLVEFLHIFGKNGIRTILKPDKNHVFQPTIYKLPSMEKIALASLVNERLGTMKNQENLSARRRLYHRLDVICPVEDILKGEFPEEDIPRIKKALNLSQSRTLNLAGYFSAKIEEKCSPEFLIAGDASVCCMGLGSEKAVDYALKPGFGIFNIYFKDRIIANSLLWINNKDTLVIDNIEVHPNYKQHDAYIREMYHQMLKDMHKIYPNIVQGSSYNDLKLYTDKCPYGILKEWNPVSITGHFYSDARNTCYLIRGDEAILKERTSERFFNEDDEEEVLQIVNAF